MAIETLTNRAQYTADGTITIFPFPYKFFEATDLKVYVGTSLKTLTTDYTVQGIPPGSFASGGNVVFGSAPAALSIITIVRSVPRKQPSDFQDYPNYAAAADTFEQELDRRAMCEQELADEISRILRIPETDPVGLDMTLPPQSERLGKFAFYDNTEGRPAVAAGMASVPVTSWAAQLLDDPDLLTGQKTLGLIPAGASAVISAFIQNLLDDASAVAAKSTLEIAEKQVTLLGGQIASPFSIAGIANPALAALNDTDVAFIDDILESLRRYHWNGSTFALVGSGLSIAGIANPALAALNDTDVAFIDDTLQSLRRYHWNGSTFALVGSGLSIAGIANPALAALSDTDVAFIDTTLQSLRRYHWNGTTFELVGSGLAIPAAAYSCLAALSSTDVVFFDDTYKSLRRYHWNGSTFALVGSGLAIAGAGTSFALAALNDTDVAFIDDILESLRRYHWNGSTFALVGSGLSIAGIANPALAALNDTDVAFIDDTLQSLRRYRPERTETVLVPA